MNAFRSNDALEKAFRHAEEAAERRAQRHDDEQEESASVPAPLQASRPPQSANDAAARARKRRRGSISISRIGTFQDLALLADGRGTMSPTPWTNAPITPMYHVQNNESASSLTSEESNGSYCEEETHTTLKQTIIGRRNTLTRAVGDILSRGLKSPRSRNTLSSRDGEVVMVGVSVQQATFEHGGDVDGEAAVTGRVHRNENVPVRRARGFSEIASHVAKKFRRTSLSVLKTTGV